MDISKLKNVQVKMVKTEYTEVFVRKLTLKGRERIDEIVANFISEDNKNKYIVGLKKAVLLSCICDKDGKSVLSEADVDELDSNIADILYTESVDYNRLFKPIEDNVQSFLAPKV